MAERKDLPPGTGRFVAWKKVKKSTGGGKNDPVLTASFSIPLVMVTTVFRREAKRRKSFVTVILFRLSFHLLSYSVFQKKESRKLFYPLGNFRS
jgi:hypothetical protein